MKKIFALAALVFTQVSFAATPINMACVTEFPTTSFIAYTEGEDVTVRIIHHNGPKYMPIWSSIITPNDLPTINEAAQALYDLGSLLEFKMPAKACERIDGKLINCFGTQPPVDINGHKVSLWALHTMETNERSFAGEFSWINSSVALEVDGKTFHVPMRYASYECFEGFSKTDLKSKLQAKNLFLK